MKIELDIDEQKTVHLVTMMTNQYIKDNFNRIAKDCISQHISNACEQTTKSFFESINTDGMIETQILEMLDNGKFKKLLEKKVVQEIDKMLTGQAKEKVFLYIAKVAKGE